MQCEDLGHKYKCTTLKLVDLDLGAQRTLSLEMGQLHVISNLKSACDCLASLQLWTGKE